MLIFKSPTARFLQTLLFLSGTTVATASDADPIGSVELNSTVRGFPAGGRECYEAALPPGTLRLEVAVPGGSAAQPRVLFRGRSDLAAEAFDLIEESAASLLVNVRAQGSYLLCVAAQDPRQRLEEYKLINAFAAGRGLAYGDPDEDDPDPETLAFDPGSRYGDPDEDDPDPETLTFGPGEDSAATAGRGRRLREILASMCAAGEVDDHGDAFACATVLEPGGDATGEIRNDWGDDGDCFAFRLTELATVEIATTGDVDTYGSLYDRSGHRLGADDDGGGANFRLVKTLGPGWYFVRVEGRQRSQGAYRLRVDVLSRS